MHRNISRGLSKHLKIRNNLKTLSTAPPKENENTQEVKNDCDKEKNVCLNPLGIQMLSQGIHSQVFKNIQRPYDCNRPLTDKEQELVKVSLEHLKKHNLGTSQPEVLPEVDFKLPKLFGKTIDEHFKKIAEDYISKYLTAAKKLAANSLPPQPKIWNYEVGWTKYLSNGQHRLVDFPSDDALVLDVEVCVSSGLFPTLAVAVSQHAWYSWCSERLCKEQFVWSQKIHLKDLIPLETKVQQTQLVSSFLKERIIIGHNVSYDRARIKEQYFLKASKIRFLDTMSMHIAISGLTSDQRALLTDKRKNTKKIQEAKSKMSKSSTTDWMHVSSLNSLAEVYKFYCGETLKKEKRDVFVNGTINDVRKDFQTLMSYCASDVHATHSVFQKLLPIFSERFPHPVTLAGMLEMSTAYLPVNNNWDQYLEMAQTMYDDLEKEMKMYLMHVANDACELVHEERYKNDVWLKDLDWSTKDIRLKKSSTKSKSTQRKISDKSHATENEENNESYSYNKLASYEPPEIDLEEDKEHHIPKTIQTILNTSQNMYKVRPVLSGYPNWYRELCVRPTDDDSWSPEPFLINTQMQIAPKLLRLKWDGHPLYYDRKHGWGYLVAKKEDSECTIEDSNTEIEMTSNGDIDGLWKKLEEGTGDQVELSKMWYYWNKKKKDKKTKKKVTEKPDHSRPVSDVEIPGYVFYRLPHKDGQEHRVGNPLAKDFLTKIESGILQAGSGIQAEMVLKLSKMLSYWKNSHKRIKSQMVIWLNKSGLSNHVTLNSSYEETNRYGAILPQIITSGTFTRRAVESTWLSASNAYPDRLGSELKSMIQAPPGFNFVGADVDSGELWIASVFGDSHFTGIHGCTAFGWMTLQGKKNDGTDLHSRTASTVGITRKQAKVLNYSRMYGASQSSAQQLLMQFNPQLSEEEARTKAQIMFSASKGIRGYILNENGEIIYKEFKDLKEKKIKSKSIFTRREIMQMLIACNSPLKMDDVIKKTVWMGGSVSEMFNKLEEIAQSENPQTPVLSCRISQALEPAFVNNSFMPSRIHWVVQSSAVDYLHMLLTAMHWLCITYKIQARFSISVHDEVRYLVKDSDKYRAVLALQIANLLTRSMFAYQLKMYDLPQSVAFFSSVEIDTVWRKEVTMDCKTPSNPHGLLKGYGIDAGEALDIYEILLKTNGSLKK